MEEKEGPIWFWKIFGGAVIGMVALLTVTLLNTIHNSNQQNKSDLNYTLNEIKSDIRLLDNDINIQKEKLFKIENYNFSNEINSISEELDQVSNSVIVRNEKIASIESTLAALKQQTETDSYKELYEKIISLEQELKSLKEMSRVVTETSEAKKTSLMLMDQS